MGQPILWVHGDCLDPTAPIFERYPHAPAIFVWDVALLKEWQIRLKRLVFLYECLLDLPVAMYRGEVAPLVNAFVEVHGGDRVVTMASPSPRFRAICQQLAYPLEILEPEPFVTLPANADLKRFFRYWKLAKPQLGL
ncbi:hypothetical protein [Thermosynechococcus sp. FA-CM-4201]